MADSFSQTAAADHLRATRSIVIATECCVRARPLPPSERFEHVFGMGWIDYQNQNQAVAKAFHDALAANSARMGALTAAACDFLGINKIVDVGGGYGGLLISILKANPTIRGVLFDRDPIIAGVRRMNDEAFRERVDFVRAEAKRIGRDRQAIKISNVMLVFMVVDTEEAAHWPSMSGRPCGTCSQNQ